jgi:hypothetical protein
MLMAIQITKLNEYVPKGGDDEFEMTETTVVRIGDSEGADDEIDDDPF